MRGQRWGPLWIFKQDNLTGTGIVYLVTATPVGRKVDFHGQGIASRQSAVVLVGANCGASAAAQPEHYHRSTVAGVPPARRTRGRLCRRSGLDR